MCIVPDCDHRGRNKEGAGPCEAHYYQQRRGRPITPVHPYGSSSDPCAAGDCDNPRARSRYCHKHAARVARHGDASVVIPLQERKYAVGRANHMWKADVGYFAWHNRLRRSQGPASNYMCGCGNQASEWAYCGPRSPRERLPYVPDERFYMPMCHRCHVRYDQRARLAEAGQLTLLEGSQ